MKFTVKREELLKPLQQVSSVIGGRPPSPILSNLLLQVTEDSLQLTGIDLGIGMVARIALSQPSKPGETTVPARKFFDICRSLPEEANIEVTWGNERMQIRSGLSRFSLSTLPTKDFPKLDVLKESKIEFTLPQAALKHLLEATQFSMAHQDVRYYLNGMLFEIDNKKQKLRTVATDGHRLAMCSMPIDPPLSPKPDLQPVIVPRKGVMELVRLLDGSDTSLELKLQIDSTHIRAHVGDFILTSKLVVGKFPEYKRLLPTNAGKILEADCGLLKQAFTRVAILSDEKLRGILLDISSHQLKITANNLAQNNLAQEEAEETLEVSYKGDDMKIGFNVSYMLDVLNTLKCEKVRLSLTDSNSCVQITDSASQAAVYIVMPLRL